jgi:hypothetical protein
MTKDGQKGNAIIRATEDFIQGPVFDFFFSIGFLILLILLRDPIMPDMFHFTTCLSAEEAHFIWVMFLWLCHKCFLTLETAQETMISNEAKILSERLKVIVKGGIELFVGLLVMTATFNHFGPWIYCAAIYFVASVRSMFEGKFDLTIAMFIIAYQIQNFIVNLIDFAFFQKRHGFYIQDEIFVHMFSHKIFQTLTCFMIGFVYA